MVLRVEACSLFPRLSPSNPVDIASFVLRTLQESWAQNGRKTRSFGAQIEEWLVSKGSRISGNFAELWSGRWESNPRPKLGKIQLDAGTAVLNFKF